MTKQQVQSLFRVIFTPSASDSKVAGRQGQPSSSSSAALEDAVDTACAVTYEQVENWTLDPALYKASNSAAAALLLPQVLSLLLVVTKKGGLARATLNAATTNAVP